MSVLTPPAPAPALPAPGQREEHRPPSRRPALVLGVAFVVLLSTIVVLILESFGGSFTTYVVVDAELPASATAVALGAPVEYRNVTVGSVASQGRTVAGGLVSLTLHIDPSDVGSIPADVEATETPVSFFGDPYLVLVPPAAPGTATLQSGSTVPPLTAGQTASLQSTLGDLDTLLIGLHPAELDAALTALAGALQGQGTSLGQNLDKANSYLLQMLPLWPTVVSDLQTLVPVADQFAASTPDILTILASQTVTGETIDRRAAEVRQAITGGAGLAAQTARLLQQIQQPYAVLAADAGSFLRAAAQTPTEVERLLEGLDAWARAWTAAESSGPYLDLRTDVVVANPADLGLAVLGGADVDSYLSAGLGSGYVNPSTYNGPASIATGAAGSSPASGTGGPASAAATTSALVRALAGAPPAVVPGPAETEAVAEIFDAISGQRPTSPSVATLLLGPVLTHLVAMP